MTYCTKEELLLAATAEYTHQSGWGLKGKL